MKRKITTVLLTLVLLAGLGIMLYPAASDYYNSFHQSRAISHYAEEVANIDAETYERLWREAVEYNRSLTGRSNPFLLSEEELEEYNSILNYDGGGIMGYISIPKINCELPIYHTTEESVLQIAVGHIEGSSMPVGGESTHCVLSGHRGLPSAKLFSDLDDLVEGDTFVLRVLNETLTYQVDQIRIVLPTELDELAISEGRDFCTLVTCTPYGVNTHRLLVRGKRIENTEEAVAAQVTADAVRIDPVLVAPVAAVPMFIVVVAFLVAAPGGGKKKKKGKKNSPAADPQKPGANAGERQGPSHETSEKASDPGDTGAVLPDGDGPGVRPDPGSERPVQSDGGQQV